MLTQFKCESHYNQLHVTLYVECNMKDAGVALTYDRLFYGEWVVPFREVSTPELAERWMHRPIGERGNFMEDMEWQCYTGIRKPKSLEVA